MRTHDFKDISREIIPLVYPQMGIKGKSYTKVGHMQVYKHLTYFSEKTETRLYNQPIGCLWLLIWFNDDQIVTRGNCKRWNAEWNGIWNRIWIGIWNEIYEMKPMEELLKKYLIIKACCSTLYRHKHCQH